MSNNTLGSRNSIRNLKTISQPLYIIDKKPSVHSKSSR